MNGYLKIKDIAKCWELSERRVKILCLQGCIPGAIKSGTT